MLKIIRFLTCPEILIRDLWHVMDRNASFIKLASSSKSGYNLISALRGDAVSSSEKPLQFFLSAIYT